VFLRKSGHEQYDSPGRHPVARLDGLSRRGICNGVVRQIAWRGLGVSRIFSVRARSSPPARGRVTRASSLKLSIGSRSAAHPDRPSASFSSRISERRHQHCSHGHLAGVQRHSSRSRTAGLGLALRRRVDGEAKSFAIECDLRGNVNIVLAAGSDEVAALGPRSFRGLKGRSGAIACRRASAPDSARQLR